MNFKFIFTFLSLCLSLSLLLFSYQIYKVRTAYFYQSDSCWMFRMIVIMHTTKFNHQTCPSTQHLASEHFLLILVRTFNAWNDRWHFFCDCINSYITFKPRCKRDNIRCALTEEKKSLNASVHCVDLKAKSFD